MNTEWIVGRRSVQEALKAGRQLEKLLVAEGAVKGGSAALLKKARERGIPVQQVPRSRLDRLAAGANHQGIVAEAAAYEYARLEDLFRRAEERGEPPFFILLDGIEDPHNLGSILRTADAAGAHGVIIPKRRGRGPYSRRRQSLGRSRGACSRRSGDQSASDGGRAEGGGVVDYREFAGSGNGLG